MTNKGFAEWIAAHENVGHISVLICDLNGVFRGKRIPVSQGGKIPGGGVKLALSTMGFDIWGEDAVASGQVFETGDPDGICLPTGRGPYEVNWTGKSSAIVPMWMFTEAGEPHMADPRQALASILKGYEKLGLTPVCATELEFYLYDPQCPENGAPLSPITKKPVTGGATYSIAGLTDFEDFLNDVYAACARMDVPADAAISESGCGQFEINLYHVNDALKAADDAVLFKQIVKGVARKHGLGATFMAKPYGDMSGSGLHIHFSVVDKSGSNIFDNETAEGSDDLRYAVGGLIDTMAEFTLFSAPHYNSYQRLRPHAHAPTKIAWGYENRTTAIRIPNGPTIARRIEYRVAGADANPYLVLAAVLGGALYGLENKVNAPEPVQGSTYDSDGIETLPESWSEAIQAFEQGKRGELLFGGLLRQMYLASKRQEYEHFASKVEQSVRDIYIDVV